LFIFSFFFINFVLNQIIFFIFYALIFIKRFSFTLLLSIFSFFFFIRIFSFFISFFVSYILLLLQLIHPHLFKFHLNLQPILIGCNYPSLGDLLSIFMIKYHSHCMFQVFKLFRINWFNLAVTDFAIFNQREKYVCR
jgi:hypothetical protein